MFASHTYWSHYGKGNTMVGFIWPKKMRRMHGTGWMRLNGAIVTLRNPGATEKISLCEAFLRVKSFPGCHTTIYKLFLSVSSHALSYKKRLTLRSRRNRLWEADATQYGQTFRRLFPFATHFRFINQIHTRHSRTCEWAERRARCLLRFTRAGVTFTGTPNRVTAPFITEWSWNPSPFAPRVSRYECCVALDDATVRNKIKVPVFTVEP